MKKIIAVLSFLILFGVGRSFAANNTTPIFTSTADIQGVSLTGSIGLTSDAGNGTIGTNMFKAFQADTTHGSFVQKIRIHPAATASTAMTASVIRLYLSTSTTGATDPSTTWVFQEVAVGAVTAAHTSNSVNFYEVPCNFALNAGWTILASIDDNLAANTRWQVEVFAEDF